MSLLFVCLLDVLGWYPLRRKSLEPFTFRMKPGGAQGPTLAASRDIRGSLRFTETDTSL